MLTSNRKPISRHTVDRQKQEQHDILKSTFQVWKLAIIERSYKKLKIERTFRTLQEALALKRQKDWRNHIRAVVHHNYSQYLKVWNGWIGWVAKQHLKRAKIEIAKDHSKRKLLGIVLDGLKLYRCKRKEKQCKREAADGQYHQFALKSMFKSWRRLYFFKSNQRSAGDLAVYMYSHNFKSKFFRNWTWKVLLSKKQKESELKAEMIYWKWLLSHVFSKWILVARKKSLLQYALCEYDREKELNLIKGFFHAWKHNYCDWVRVKESETRAAQKHNRAQTKIFYRHWKLKIGSRRSLAEKQRHAERFLVQKQQRRVLLGLKSLLQVKQAAESNYNATLVRATLFFWLSRLKHHRKVILEKELQMGTIHHRQKLQIKVLRAFQLNAALQKAVRQQERLASDFLARSVLKFSFENWIKKAKQKYFIRDMVIVADGHHLDSIWKHCWKLWFKSIDEKFSFQRKQHVAMRYRRQELLRSGLNAFIAFGCVQSKKRLQKHYADIQYQQKLLQKNFTLWEDALELRVSNRSRNTRADQFRQYCNYKIIWNRWCKAIVQRKQAVVRWNLTEAHYERKVLQKHFGALLDYVRSINSFRKEVRAFHARQKWRIIKRYFFRWDSYSGHLGLLQLDSRVFFESIQENTLDHYFSRWRNMTCESIEKKDYIDKLLGSHLYHQEMDRKSRIWSQWTKLYQHRKRSVRISRKADQYRLVCTIRGMFREWNKRFKHRNWLNYNISLAKSFSLRFMGRKHFGVWYNSRPDWKSLYFQRHILPVKHYQTKIFHSSLSVWKENIQESKEFGSKLRIAEEWRQKLITQKTLYDWFMKEQEILFEAQRHSGLSNWQLYVAAKYGRRWRLKALNGSEQRKKLSRFTRPLTSSLHLSTKTRPAPRKPSFVFDSTQSRFRKLVKDQLSAVEKEQAVSNMKVTTILPRHLSLVPSGFSLRSRLENLSRIEPQETRKNTNLIEKSYYDRESNEIFGSIELQPPKACVLSTSPRKDAGTQHEKPATPPPTPIKKGNPPSIDQLRQKLMDIQSVQQHTQQLRKKLCEIDQQLSNYGDATFSHRLGLDLDQLLSTRFELMIELNTFESKQKVIKEELIHVKEEIALRIREL